MATVIHTSAINGPKNPIFTGRSIVEIFSLSDMSIIGLAARIKLLGYLSSTLKPLQTEGYIIKQVSVSICPKIQRVPIVVLSYRQIVDN
jgi:hypothetical protein